MLLSVHSFPLPLQAVQQVTLHRCRIRFLNSCLPFVWIIVALALIGVGLMCIIGSERSKEAAKSKAVYVVIGCGVVLGAMYLAKGVADLLTMGNFTVS